MGVANEETTSAREDALSLLTLREETTSARENALVLLRRRVRRQRAANARVAMLMFVSVD